MTLLPFPLPSGELLGHTRQGGVGLGEGVAGSRGSLPSHWRVQMPSLNASQCKVVDAKCFWVFQRWVSVSEVDESPADWSPGETFKDEAALHLVSKDAKIQRDSEARQEDRRHIIKGGDVGVSKEDWVKRKESPGAGAGGRGGWHMDHGGFQVRLRGLPLFLRPGFPKWATEHWPQGQPPRKESNVFPTHHPFLMSYSAQQRGQSSQRSRRKEQHRRYFFFKFFTGKFSIR